MTRDYPNAFRDIVASSQRARRLTTYGKLLYKLKNRLDNSNRRVERTRIQIEAPAIPEAYGCLGWQILTLPEGETEETLREKEERLREIYDQGIRNWDWCVIKELMNATFILERRKINSQFVQRRGRRRGRVDEPEQSTTADIQESFPMLFTYKGMIHHFKTLTNVSYSEKIKDMLEDLSGGLMDFLVQKHTGNIRIKSAMLKAKQAEQVSQNIDLLAVILMLIRVLNESGFGLIRLVEPPVSINSLSTNNEIPGTPLIIGEGMSIFQCSKFFVSFDGQVRCAIRSFKKALGIAFCSYFVFNMQYNAKVANTLDFIQRSILDLNPEVGSKVPPEVRGRNTISGRLSKIMTDIAAYKENLGSEEEDGNLVAML